MGSHKSEFIILLIYIAITVEVIIFSCIIARLLLHYVAIAVAAGYLLCLLIGLLLVLGHLEYERYRGLTSCRLLCYASRRSIEVGGVTILLLLEQAALGLLLGGLP